IPNGQAAEAEWKAKFDAWAAANPALATEMSSGMNHILPAGWDSNLPVFTPAEPMATRASAGKALTAIAAVAKDIFGGSADLNSSTETALKGEGDFENPNQLGDETAEGTCGGGWGFLGRNIHYGVREHAMGAAANGIAIHGGLRPYTATFFNFSDYMKPAMRLAALMELPVIYVFTHDSIGLGEDGPTHQPIEQLAMLRAMPNLTVIRPADANEAVEAWKVAVAHSHGPVALILSRQKVPNVDRTVYPSAEGLQKGAYVLSGPSTDKPGVVLIGTGSEVSIAVAAADLLNADGTQAQVVSMPSTELFDAQDATYRESVLPTGVPVVTIEAAATLGWHKYIGGNGFCIGIDHFGASAPAETIYSKFGLTPERMAEEARKLIK
ncbi:MAG: transketolase C-terminal domain-containing protein, partial [Chthonomonadales bacterium]